VKNKKFSLVVLVLSLGLLFVLTGCSEDGVNGSEDSASEFDAFIGKWTSTEAPERIQTIEIRKKAGGVFELYYEYEINDELHTSEWQLKRDPDEGQLYLIADRGDNFTYDAENDQLINRKNGFKVTYDRK